jgi:hypothetical protein
MIPNEEGMRAVGADKMQSQKHTHFKNSRSFELNRSNSKEPVSAV